MKNQRFRPRGGPVLALMLALTLTLSPVAGAISVEEARQLLQEHYIDEIPQEILNLPTIDEITDALGDPYTYYMTPEQYQSFLADSGDADVVGIGVMVDTTANGLSVTSVAPGSPASKGGIQVGDLIVAANGTTLEAAGSAEALVSLIKGDVDTPLTITVKRGVDSFDLELTRAEVVFPTVTGQVVDGHIGWLDCTQFGENSGSYFQTYINEENDQADRWVVDLRSNPGGRADSVVEAIGHVVGNRTAAYLVDRNGDLGSWRPNPLPVETPGLIDEPLVVLVDANSASASELFAAAMRDYGAGLIIGTRTFGKGIAQGLLEQEDGSAMRVTTYRYYSPAYVTPDRSGVLPHLVVDPNLADEVARLLCGEEATPSPVVLALELAGRTWYVHKEAATSAAYAPAFSELLGALSPGTPMDLNGVSVGPEAVAAAWGTEFQSRWLEDASDSPYALEINTLATLGGVLGDGSGSFLPQEELTRAELVSLVTQAMGYWCWESQRMPDFPDVSEGDWYAQAVRIAYHMGLIQGDEDGRFAPNDTIDYQQFLTILIRMGAQADLTVENRLTQVAEQEGQWPQAQQFSPWARGSAEAAFDLGLLTGELDEIAPTTPITREVAAALIYNLMEYTGILTPVESTQGR